MVRNLEPAFWAAVFPVCIVHCGGQIRFRKNCPDDPLHTRPECGIGSLPAAYGLQYSQNAGR